MDPLHSNSEITNGKSFSEERKCLLCYKTICATAKDNNVPLEVKIKKGVLEYILNVSPIPLESLQVSGDSYLNEIDFCDSCSATVTESYSLYESIQRLQNDLGNYKNEMISKVVSSNDNDTKENAPGDSVSITDKIRHLICPKEVAQSTNIDHDLPKKRRKSGSGNDVEVGRKRRKSGRVCASDSDLPAKEYEPGPIRISVIEKQKRISRETRFEYYYMLLLETVDNEMEKVEALSFDYKFGQYFQALEIGSTYDIQGNIWREPKNPYFVRDRSELTWEYKFWDIHTLRKVEDSKIIFNTDPAQEFYEGEEVLTIPMIKDCLSRESRNEFKDRLIKEVELVSGYIYRYVGCISCQKSNLSLEKPGIYKCLGCRKEGTSEEIFENFMIIHNMVIKDSNGNELRDIVCFNNTVRDFLKKESKEFKYDDELESRFEEHLGRKINLRVSFQRCHSRYHSNGYKIVANTIAVKGSNDGETSHNVDATPFVPRHVVDVKNLHIQYLDHHDWNIEQPKESPVELETQTRYDLTSQPAGYALLINVARYPRGDERKGCIHDVKNVLGVLRNLNFKVFLNRQDEEFNLDDLQQRIDSFKQRLIQDRISASLVFVMGHGYNDFFALSGNETVNINEGIIEPFSTTNFNVFALKPKIFLFNLCRTFPENQNGNRELIEWKKVPTPDIKNALFCFSTQRGHYSLRDPSYGSFFVNFLVGGLKAHAASVDLETILKEVQNQMEKQKHIYTIEYSDGSEKDEVLMPSMPFGLVFRKFFFKVAQTEDENPSSELDYDVY